MMRNCQEGKEVEKGKEVISHLFTYSLIYSKGNRKNTSPDFIPVWLKY